MRSLMMMTVFGFLLVSSGTAQIVRQESTNVLKKAVYTVNLAECPQRLVEYNEEEYHRVEHWAIVAIPELTLTNTPSIELRRPSSGEPSGWNNVPEVEDAVIGDQVINFYWKWESTVYGDLYQGSWDPPQVMIIVVYESQSQPDLKVSNTGTGKSLALEWTTNAPNAKIEGYKVYRRSSVE